MYFYYHFTSYFIIFLYIISSPFHLSSKSFPRYRSSPPWSTPRPHRARVRSRASKRGEKIWMQLGTWNRRGHFQIILSNIYIHIYIYTHTQKKYIYSMYVFVYTVWHHVAWSPKFGETEIWKSHLYVRACKLNVWSSTTMTAAIFRNDSSRTFDGIVSEMLFISELACPSANSSCTHALHWWHWRVPW